MKKYFLLFMYFFISGALTAQNIIMSDGTFTQCNGFLQDSGGANGSYGNNENFTLTICSNNPDVDGSHINIQFPGVDIAAGDMLCFFDGPDVTAPMLSCHDDYQVPQITIQATAANASGCLTMTFVSDGAGTAQGWNAAISCVPSCQTIIADLVSSIPEVMPVDTGWIDVCPGDRVFFTGAGIYPQDGLVYNHSDLTSNFEWNFGDGDIGYGPNVSHRYDEPGGYIVQLKITDQLDCYSTNFITQRIRVSGPPNYNLLADLPAEMCVGDTVSLSAVVSSNDSIYTLEIDPEEYSFQLEGVRSDSVALPDGTGEVYYTPIAFSDFSPGQFLGSANDIVEVCVVMEHSYLRDLVIRLECPDGSEITLHEFAGVGSGGETFLGIPFENDEGTTPVQGTGFEYCWTATAPNTWIEYCDINGDPQTLPAGDYAPFEGFDNLIGCPMNGEWRINVEDLWGIDNGWIFSWSISFQESLYPNIETFTPSVDSFNWVDQASIVFYEPDSIVSVPQNAGTANYVFEVFDGFGCTWDTALNVTVLPATHPDCYNCGENVALLNDTLICEGESVQFDINYFGPTSDEVVFESYPLYAIGNENHPLNNPYESRITITNVNPAVVVDPQTNICRVCLDLDTDFASDIHLYLISPDGQYLELSTTNGGGGDNYTNTCFTTTATVPIQTGTAPFTGDFIPEGNWADLDGSPINGDWTLSVSDAFGLNDYGFLRTWSICFNSENNVTYTWENNSTLSCSNCPDPTVTPTTTEEYYLVVEDSYGCVHKDTVQVEVQQQLAGPTIINCLSLENGVAEIEWDALGGATGYEVSINNGPWIAASEAQSHILTGLSNNEVINIRVRGIAPSSNCSVAITDYSCTYELPCSLAGNLIDVTSTSCYGIADGVVNVSAFDGINPIMFSLDGQPFQSSGSYLGVAGGAHFIEILDDEQCIDTLFFTVPQPDSIAITFDVDSTGCAAGDDGMATANVSGGQGFYTYSWNTLPAQITQTATSLTAGIFSVTVTDSNDCTGVEEVEVFQPLQLNAVTSQDSVSCFGVADGSASVSASGGTLPYTFAWSSGDIASTAIDLPAGNYEVTITDANNCSIIESAVVLSPPEIIIQTTDVQDAFCFNGSDGAATVFASGGVPPFTYQWNDPANQMDSTATGLTAGIYTVVVTDADGCTNMSMVTVGEGDPINMMFSVTAATCWDSPDGTATVNASGGVEPFTFLWNDPTGQTDSIAIGLLPGSYIVSVTDANNCTTTGNVFVPAPSQIDLMISATTTSCPNIDDGTATIVASGGTGPYTYQWNDPLMQQSDLIFNLVPGVYTVTVTDDNMCQAVDSIEVISPNALTILSITPTSASCFDENDGAAEVMLEGGTAPYSFLWSDPLMQFANPAINLFAGTYYVTVTDANNCEVQDSIIVTEPNLLSLNVNWADVLCFDEATGSASVTATGGTMPYAYAWSNMETNATITNLEDNTYFVTVTDLNGCQQDTFVTITEPTTPITTSIGQNLVGCFAANQGVAEVVAMGGTGMNYTYEWSSGATTSVAANLSAVWQYVTVTDENNCEVYDSILIQEYAEITGNIITIQPSCFGAADGQVGINIVSGGVGSGNITDYTYEWNTTPVQTGDFIQGLVGGVSYTVTITDMDGCSGTASILLEDPPLIQANPTINNVTCNGLSDASITVNPIGVNATYAYEWDANTNSQTTQTASNLSAGSYSVTITDDMNCAMDTIIMVEEPDLLQLSLEATINPCSQDSLGVIVPTVSGGTSPYFYQWSNGQTTSSASGLGNGVYAVTIIDVNDCEITDSIEILTVEPLWAIVSADSVQCFGDANGSITVEPQGGSAPYSYSLNGIDYGGASTMIGLTAGYYSVYVRDVNGCVWTIGKEVESPEEFMVFTAADSLFMELGDSVRLFSSWENGRGFVEMFWTAPYEGTLSCVCPAPWADPDFTTDYELYGIDEYGCEDTDQLRVIVNKPRGVFVPTGFTPNDDGVNDQLFVFGRIGTKVMTYRIYDRWGERVFEAADYLVNDETQSWDGTFRSKPLPAGIYQWMVEVEFLDGITEVFFGHTTLIR